MIRVPLQVRYNDYDDRGHVNNAVYLTYFEIARVAAWREAVPGSGLGFIVAAAQISYRSPAVPGDPLAVEISTGEVRTKAFTWRYRVLDERDDRLVAEGETTQVLYDYAAKRSIEIPGAVREGLLRQR